MVGLAIGLGLYSYVILALGLLGWLSKGWVLMASLPFVYCLTFWLKKKVKFDYLNWKKAIKKDKLIGFLLFLLGVQVLINFLGAISPELSFDALWYHLTPAKLYVQNQRILFFPGELLWPANLTRLTEMFYTVSLLFGNEILAKIIHFFFGLLSALALFNLLKRYFSLRFVVLGVVTFYTMLVVGWLSTTAYVELARTFFEILALDLFLQWLETKKESLLYESGILIGLAMATKIMALGSLLSFLILILILKQRKALKPLLSFAFFAILAVSPWLALSFVHYGNPLYPLFGSTREVAASLPLMATPSPLAHLLKIPSLLWQTTFSPDAIISPVFLIFLPLVLVLIWRQNLTLKISALYFLLAIFFTKDASTRYLLPYLPSLLLVILSVFQSDWAKEKLVQKILISIFILGIFLNLSSRILATRKFIPYLLGQESKTQFLSQNLNFAFGDFYDTDNWFKKNIQKDDLVLIYNIHNLYYVDFPFVHESWAKSGTYFTHILVAEGKSLPEKFGQRLLLYQNPKTGVSVYVFGDKLP